MKFEYKKIGKTPEGDIAIKPIIPIKLIGNDELSYEVLVDSGADICIFDLELADIIGIDAKRGEKVFFIGVTGSQRVCYMHNVKIEVGGKRFTTRVAFAALPGNSYGIVGQRGFFEKFKVIFDYQKKQVELREKETLRQAVQKAA